MPGAAAAVGGLALDAALLMATQFSKDVLGGWHYTERLHQWSMPPIPVSIRTLATGRSCLHHERAGQPRVPAWS
jgi:hypothetical protein